MSIDLIVYLREGRLPTHSGWQSAIDREGLGLVLEEFDPRTSSGFRPCRLNGADCGFEFYFGRLEDQDKELQDRIGDRDRVVTLLLHGGHKDDLEAAMGAAAVLTEVSDGVFYDPQGGRFASGRGVFEMMRAQEEAERERGRRNAEKDAAITNQRCPHCGAPCPSYRKTCKACGRDVQRT
jgi:hypothetical protein